MTFSERLFNHPLLLLLVCWSYSRIEEPTCQILKFLDIIGDNVPHWLNLAKHKSLVWLVQPINQEYLFLNIYSIVLIEKFKLIFVSEQLHFRYLKLVLILIFVTYLNSKQEWDKSFTFKPVNVVTKLVPSSGKSSLMNTESTQLVLIMEILIFNSKESMFITMKPLEVDMSPELSWWILNQEQWTLLELDHSVNSSDLTTLSLVKPELVITGPKVIILKELNLSTQFLMLPERKLKDVIVFKVSKSPTPLVVELDQVWELSSSPKSEKNIQTESWKPSQLSPHQRSLIPSLSHTMPPFQSISWSKMLTNAWLLITKLFMISASELLSSPPQLMVILTIWSLLPCQESPAALDSQVNLTLIWEN